MAPALHVSMLGGFSIRCEQQVVTNNDNRSRKVWHLLAYMIYNHNRILSQEELIQALWGEDGSSNPTNALKTMLHRVRATLDQLYPNAGHDLILRRTGGYVWNPDIPFTFDVEEFDTLCKLASHQTDPELRLQTQQKALELYRGDLLPKLSSEAWIIPIAAYFRNQYLQLVQEVLAVFQEKQQTLNIVSLCYAAISIDPYNETLYQHLMRALLAMGDHQGAITLYQDISQILYDEFGIMPSDETRSIYRQATRTVNYGTASLDAVREQLRESNDPPGAMLCEFDFFKILYHREARSIIRSGDVAHLALFSITDAKNQPLVRRTLDLAMDNLEILLCKNLRRGDIVTRYNASQILFLLPKANYENSCKVCERIRKAFFRQYPHSAAYLHYCVQPLEPKL